MKVHIAISIKELVAHL